MADTIIVGYDGTEGADAALDEALHLAVGLGGDLLVVFAYKKVVSGGESRDLGRQVGGMAAGTLAEGGGRACAGGLPARRAVMRGTPADVLCDLGDSEDARYIVVGSYGERPLRGALVGATPYKLVHLSSRPVVVVRAPEPS